MKKLLNYFSIIKRALSIKDVQDTRQSVEDIIHDNLMNMSSIQRATTLFNLVNRVKESNSERLEDATNNLLVEEESKTILGRIQLFNIV